MPSTRLEALIAMVAASKDAPANLLFWLQHLAPDGGRLDLAQVWKDCPRADWMLWIARKCGVAPAKVNAAEISVDLVQQRAAELRAASFAKKDANVFVCPRQDSADKVRDEIGWSLLVPALDVRPTAAVA